MLATQPVTAEAGTVYFTAPGADGFFALQFFRTGTADALHRLDYVSATAAVGFVPGGEG